MKKAFLIIALLAPLFGWAQIGCGPFTSSGQIILSSGATVSGKLIDMAGGSANGIVGNNVSNVHITKCKIVNTTGFAISLYSCTNITIDSCDIENVGFGVYAAGASQTIKVNSNYFKNINGINTTYLGHAVQFNAVNGGGSQINYNKIENIAGQALHPHDQINVFMSNGLVGDSIQVIGNQVRGGQLTAYPTTGSTGAGVIVGDVGGSYQVCRNNILINCGCAGVQCIQGTGGSVNGISIDHNIIYNNVVSPVAAQGITVLGTVSNIKIKNNRVWWKNHNGNAVITADGETGYYFGNPYGTLAGVTMSGNNWLDVSIDPNTAI